MRIHNSPQNRSLVDLSHMQFFYLIYSTVGALGRDQNFDALSQLQYRQVSKDHRYNRNGFDRAAKAASGSIG